MLLIYIMSSGWALPVQELGHRGHFQRPTGISGKFSGTMVNILINTNNYLIHSSRESSRCPRTPTRDFVYLSRWRAGLWGSHSSISKRCVPISGKSGKKSVGCCEMEKGLQLKRFFVAYCRLEPPRRGWRCCPTAPCWPPPSPSAGRCP